LSFPYVCPEPVLVKRAFLYINGAKRPFFTSVTGWVKPGMWIAGDGPPGVVKYPEKSSAFRVADISTICTNNGGLALTPKFSRVVFARSLSW
jgi:hypothetical protein